jgi:hypothetical protein
MQQQKDQAKHLHKQQSLAVPALALLLPQARRVRALGEACRHPVLRLLAGMRPLKQSPHSAAAGSAYRVSVRALASPM